MGKIIGKILATEKNPSTMEEFYFWTKPELILNPFMSIDLIRKILI